MTQPNPDIRIHCDICSTRSPYNDPREPWECFGEYNNKPTWRCGDCIKAVADATQRRYDKSIYPSIVFDDEETQLEWNKRLEEAGWHEMTVGPSINIEEVKTRRFGK